MSDAMFSLLVDCVRAAPSADNCQPWGVRSTAAQQLLIAYDQQRVAGRSFAPTAPATLLAIGAVQENLVQAQQAWGLRLDISRCRPGSAGAGYLELSWDEAVPPPDPDMAAGHPLFARHTNRFPYKRDPLPAAAASDVAAMQQGEARTVWLTDEAVGRMASEVNAASQVRFQTREVHEWLGHSLRFSAEAVARGDGLDVATLALPPGGGAFLRFLGPWSRMRRFNAVGGYRMMAAIEAAQVRRAPALLAITAPDGADAVLDAGMLMQRAWIALNAAGLAVQPYYVIPDQFHRLAEGKVPPGLEEQVAAIGQRCAGVLGLHGGAQLQMLFRVGYARRPAVRARRLPAEALLLD